MGKIKIARATKKDDLKQIAELIYLTDVYIYPYWFNTIENAINELTEIVESEDTIYSYKNCVVAKADNKIVGVIVFFDDGSNIDNDYSKWNKSFNADYTIKNYIKPLIDECKKFKFVSIPNVAVLPEYRRCGIATKMFEKVFSLYKNKPFVLEVLEENVPALKLYQKLGFKIDKEYNGFNGKGLPQPKVMEMKKD